MAVLPLLYALYAPTATVFNKRLFIVVVHRCRHKTEPRVVFLNLQTTT